MRMRQPPEKHQVQHPPAEPSLTPGGASHVVSRRLCEALDLAIQYGQIEQAERIARSAERMAHGDTRLTERLARLRLARRDAEGALHLIDRCRHTSASIRLLRIVCQMRVGRVGDAHVALQQWSRRASAPTDARLLLALLEWTTDGPAAAVSPLRENIHHLVDLDSLQLLMLSAFERGCLDQASTWAGWLRAIAAFGRSEVCVDLLLGALDVVPCSAAMEQADRSPELALELTVAETVIPVLVAALRLEPDDAVRVLLMRSIEACLDDLSDQATAMASIGRLALEGGETATARRWAERAIEANPLSAPAAQLLRDCNADTDQPLPVEGAHLGLTGHGRAA